MDKLFPLVKKMASTGGPCLAKWTVFTAVLEMTLEPMSGSFPGTEGGDKDDGPKRNGGVHCHTST